MICNKDVLKDLFKKDEVIKFLKFIRGILLFW